MNRDSNKHTYIFAVLMVLSVAFVLSFTSESLKDLQNANVKKEKMQNILSSVGINVTRDESEDLYMDYISEELSLKSDGTIDDDIDAFDINLALEVKKDSEPLHGEEKIQEQVKPNSFEDVDSKEPPITVIRIKNKDASKFDE